ncbi:hypothetical protein BH09SUM1_BH09SUM1_24070 [soil metagenome]
MNLRIATVSLAVLSFLSTSGLVFSQPPPPPPPPPAIPPLPPVQAPPGNAITTTKANLGKALFWDEQLSSTGTVSCGTCHVPSKGGSDPRSIIGVTRNPGFDNVFGNADDVTGSPGVIYNNAAGTYPWHSVFGLGAQVTGRKAPSVINAALAPVLFWDGRADPVFNDPLTNAIVLTNGAALETQVVSPPTNTGEMACIGRTWTDIATNIAAARPLALSPSVPAALTTYINNRTYPALFQEAFGSAGVIPARIAMAIATYERTLYSNQAPIDSFIAGQNVLNASELRGMALFGQIDCAACHTGGGFSDGQFHYIGVRPNTEDSGHFGVTANADDRGAFKTPSLRNVSLRPPYMHTGRFATLADVVEFYNRGGDFNAANKDPRVRPRNLTAQQKTDLVAFLNTFTDPRVAAETAPFDHPTLFAGSSRAAQLLSTGMAGAGGMIPEVIAIEPPIAGNPSFTVGVTKALGGAQAVLVIDATDPGPDAAYPATAALTRTTVTMLGSGAGNGYGSYSVQIPSDQSWVGRELYGRWFVADSAAVGHVAASKAFKIAIFGIGTTATATGPMGFVTY